MPAPPTQVAVSYSWKEEREGANAGAVGQFCSELERMGIKVVRDSDRLKHGECISKFMQAIGASDFLCVFLSDGYLRSPNCMYELLVAWQRSKDNPEEFRSRVKVRLMADAPDISTFEQRSKWIDYWHAEKQRIEPLIQNYATKGLAGASLEEFRRIPKFADEVDSILQFVADTLRPASAEEFLGWIKEQFPGDSSEASVGATYEHLLAELEGLINQHPSIARFLVQVAPGLVYETSGTWHLADSVKGRRFDVCSPLEQLTKNLAKFRAQPQEWKALGEFVGGLVVLALDPQWISKQRQLARAESTNFPADAEAINVGGERRANLLHLVTCALADGRARLEKVFGKPPLDEFLVPEPAEEFRGITADDQKRAIELHLIRFVLGPDERFDPKDDRQLKIRSDRMRKVIAAALHDDHNPYVATGPRYERLTRLIRDDLAVHDLLLIHPSGDDPELLLTDYVRVLRFLGKIFDAVQTNTAGK